MDEFSLFQLTAFVHQLHHGLACAIMCEMVNYLIPDLTNTQVGVGSRPYQPIPRTASKRLRKAHSTVTVPGSQDKLFRGPEASKIHYYTILNSILEILKDIKSFYRILLCAVLTVPLKLFISSAGLSSVLIFFLIPAAYFSISGH